MKRFSLGITALLMLGTLLTGLWLGQSSAATSTLSPGSEQDPLVTKSYVDQAINTLKNSLPSGGGSQPPSNDNGTTPSDDNFIPLQVVTVPAGQRLIGFEGTEFILRSGNGTVIGSAGGGIPDLTGGRDLADRVAIPRNHLLLIPRSDQRGLRATTQLIVMVRGRWVIER